MTTTQTKRGDETRNALLEAAYQQFVQKGYHGTSMRKIAEATGITPGGIYNHFASKDDLFAAVVVAYHPLTRIFPQLMAASGDSGEERLRNAARTIATELNQDTGMINLLFIEMIECGGKHLATVATALMPKVTVFMSELGVSVDARPGVTAYGLLQTFVGTVLASIFTRHILATAGAPVAELADIEQFMDIYLHGLLRANGREASEQ